MIERLTTTKKAIVNATKEVLEGMPDGANFLLATDGIENISYLLEFPKDKSGFTLQDVFYRVESNGKWFTYHRSVIRAMNNVALEYLLQFKKEGAKK